MRRYLIFGLVGTLIGVALVLIYFFAQPKTLRGSVIEPPQPAPEVALTASSGEPFTLAQQRGRITLLFFGYTFCPDECPATLAQLRQVMQDLGKQADAVRVVLITVDPKRDTPEVLRRYLSAFGSSFTGLTGNQDQLEAVWKAYGIYRTIQPVGDNPDDYSIEHSTRLYLIDTKGQIRLTYAYGTNSEDILQDLLLLLKEG